MELEEAVKALEGQLNKGKGILKHQPVKREVCEEWTRATRAALAELYEPTAKRYLDFVAANRKIFTSFDTDPSYYLTQIVANLHRELRALEACVKEKRHEAEAQAAFLAAKGVKKAKPKTPALLWAEDAAGTQDVRAVLEERDFAVTVAGGDGASRGEALWNIAAQKGLGYGVVLVAGKGPAAASDALIAAAYLTGRLGRARVLVIADAAQKLPPVAGFLRTVELQDREKWRAEIAADASKVGK